MTLTATQFWALMERWKVPDPVALELIGFAGKIGKSGKRPRFRFLPTHQEATSFMAEIDAALAAGAQTVDWLHTKNGSLAGKTPIKLMTAESMSGMAKVLQHLNRSLLMSSLKR